MVEPTFKFLSSIVKELRKLGETAMKGASEAAKILICIIICVTILVGLAIWPSANSGLNAYHVALLVVYLVALVFFVWKLHVGQRPSSPYSETWSMTVPIQPLDPTIRNQLLSLLGSTSQKAFSRLKQANPALQERQIRGNIFMASYKNTEDGHAYVLRIPSTLRKNMDRRDEWNIKFPPGCGAVGLAFLEHEPRIAIYDSDNGWEQVYELTSEQVRAIHPDLKWVIAIQIKHPVSGEVLGVLSIDGLVLDFDVDTLKEVAVYLAQESSAYGVVLKKASKVRMITGYQEA